MVSTQCASNCPPRLLCEPAAPPPQPPPTLHVNGQTPLNGKVLEGNGCASGEIVAAYPWRYASKIEHASTPVEADLLMRVLLEMAEKIVSDVRGSQREMEERVQLNLQSLHIQLDELQTSYPSLDKSLGSAENTAQSTLSPPGVPGKLVEQSAQPVDGRCMPSMRSASVRSASMDPATRTSRRRLSCGPDGSQVRNVAEAARVSISRVSTSSDAPEDDFGEPDVADVLTQLAIEPSDRMSEQSVTDSVRSVALQATVATQGGAKPTRARATMMVVADGAESVGRALEDLLGRSADPGGLIDFSVVWLILANCFVLVLQVEYAGYKANLNLRQQEADGSWPNADTWFFVCSHILNACFVLELFARLVTRGRTYFKHVSNCFDAIIVLMSSCELYIFEVLELDALGGKLRLFRLLRLVKFLRLVRVVQTMEFFSTLRILVKTCAASMWALIWSMILLFIVIFMGGLLISELTRDFVEDSTKDMQWRIWIWRHYGTGMRAIYTLFEVTMAGCWPTYFRPLVEQVSGYYVIFSFLYITLVVFALIRIITAIFLKETLQTSSADKEMMINEQQSKRQKYLSKLEAVFKAIDLNESGKLSLDEFKVILGNPRVQIWLQLLELEFHDIEALFNLLDDGEDGEVTYEEFLRGAMRLKGQAKSIDIIEILRACDKANETLKQIEQRMEKICPD